MPDITPEQYQLEWKAHTLAHNSVRTTHMGKCPHCTQITDTFKDHADAVEALAKHIAQDHPDGPWSFHAYRKATSGE